MNAHTTDFDEFADAETPEGRALIVWARDNQHSVSFTDMSLGSAKFPDHAPMSGNGAIKFICPFHKSHVDKVEDGTLTCIGIDSRIDCPFSISCSDSACRARLPLDFIGKIKKNKWIAKLPDVAEPLYQRAIDRLHSKSSSKDTDQAAEFILEADLDSWMYKQALGDMKSRLGRTCTKEVLDDIIQRARAKLGVGKAGKNAGGIDADIAALDETSSDKQKDDVIAAIAKIDDPIHRESKIKDFKKRTGLSVTELRKAVNKLRNAAASDSGPSDEVDENGIATFIYVLDYDDNVAKHVVGKGVLRANRMIENKSGEKQEPIYTCIYEKMVRYRETGGKTTFEELSPRKFNSEISEKLYFQRRTPDTLEALKMVPEKISNSFYDTASGLLPQSPVLIDAPLYADGFKLIQEPGWHYRRGKGQLAELNIYLKKTCIRIPNVKDVPTAEDVKKALDLIFQMLKDFPFSDRKEDGTEWPEDEMPSRANAIAMIITSFVRHCIPGNTPVFMIAKPSEGSGATLLAKASMLIFDGKQSLPFPYTTNDDEMQKAIVSAILGGGTHIFFDNITEFNSPCILKSVTSEMVGGRLLGQSTLVERPNVFQWIATGKNPHVEAEMRRRIAWIWLNTKKADNGQREYSIPNLEKWIIDNRAALIWSILTLVQAWIAKGSKPFKERTLASFDEWAAIVGGILQNAGIKGFLANRPTAGTTMEDAAQYEFIEQFWKTYHADQWIADSTSVAWGADEDLALDIVEGFDLPQRKRSLRKSYKQMDNKTFALEEKTSFTFIPSVIKKQPGHTLHKEDEKPL